MFLAVVASMATVSAVQPLSAQAAQYSQFFCQYSDNATAPTDGWTASNNGAFTYFGNGCGSGGGLESSWANDIDHPYTHGAVWSYQAPANTSIAALYGTRTANAGSDRAFGSPVAYLNTDQGQIEACTRFAGCGSLNGAIAYGLNNAQAIAIGITCGGGAGGSCPAGDPTTNSLKRGQIVLNDDSSPNFTNTPSGVLLSANTTTRTRSLNYGAADQGGGLYRQRLVADATNVVVESTIDDNAGKCAKRGNGFSYRVPCRLAASGSVTLDTAVLPDGDHELRLEVRDVTEQNTASHGPWPISVDNVAPIMTGTTEVTGTAKVGQDLTCNPPSINGQNPTISYSWTRSSSDGSGRTVISGATSSTYKPTRTDESKKLQCTTTATDKGGTSSRESSLTSGPFANGGTVTIGDGPKANGPVQITAESTTLESPRPGGVLRIDPPNFSGSGPVSLAYAWLRCDANGQGCSPIAGATSSRYTITAADNGSQLIGQVTATDDAGSSVTRSTPTGTVASAPASTSPPTPDPTPTSPPASAATPGAAGAPGVAGAPGAAGVPAAFIKKDPRFGLPNGVGACREATLSVRFTKGSRTTVRYGRSATLRGRLRCTATKRVIRGAELELTSRTLGTSDYGKAKVVRTSKNGTFTTKVPKGAGRDLRLTYYSVFGDETPTEVRKAQFNVRARISLKKVRSTVGAGKARPIRFRGRLIAERGTIPKGYQLALRAKNGKKWITLDNVKVSQRGSFNYVFKCKCLRGQRFMLRMELIRGTGLPYAFGSSKAYRVRVR